MTDIILTVDRLRKTYRHDTVEVEALRGASFEIRRGEFASIMGPSGCGKSTLLYCLSGMASVTSGQARFNDTDIVALGDVERTELRRKAMGFVFQRFNLMPTLTIEKNVELALRLKHGQSDSARVQEALEQVDMAPWADTKPRHLSEGQKQRAAIARAIATEPEILFADEPTGNLDSDNSANIMDLFFSLNRRGQTIIMVTHNPALAEMTGRTFHMKDGHIVHISHGDNR